MSERNQINHATLLAANQMAWNIINSVLGNGVSGTLANGNPLTLEIATRRGLDIIRSNTQKGKQA